jgi:hypothetical protein
MALDEVYAEKHDELGYDGKPVTIDGLKTVMVEFRLCSTSWAPRKDQCVICMVNAR